MDDVAVLDTQPEGITSAVVTPVLTIVIPTLNERDNIEPLLALVASLPATPWEVIFVDDDSRDGTAELVRAVARRDPRVRCLQRIGRRGLSTACIEGVLASAAPYVAVMDADLQHDERLLPQMLETLDGGALDLVVGSRYVAGGGVGEWKHGRARISGSRPPGAHRVQDRDRRSDERLLHVRREVFEARVRRISGHGFKILLDLLASAPAAGAGQRAALQLPPAPPRREQARHPRRLGIRHAAGRQARRPLRPGPLRSLRA